MVYIFAENILEKIPIIFHDSSFGTPAINQTDSQSFSISSNKESRSSSIPDFDIIVNTPAVPHINHDAENIRDAKSLIDILRNLKWMSLRERLSLNYREVFSEQALGILSEM